MRACEELLVGRPPERKAFEAAAEVAVQGARPLQHNRYKVELLPRTIVRALDMAGEIA
jgi:xanthine dehydrogenase YagS FAD-binding subunit